nr:hypothetical protein [Spirochaetales bacterium]
YGESEAVRIASRGHAAYSELSTEYKKVMSYIVFVHSFRALMPIEVAKAGVEPVSKMIKSRKSGEKIPKHERNRMAKAILATIAIPAVIEIYMRARGFETDKAFWKWKKTVKDKNGRDVEIVTSINTILNMPAKYFHRLTSYNPIDPNTRFMQGAENIIKWELHPAYRVMFWDVKENRRSFGKDGFVYDPNAKPLAQASQIAVYSFGQMFRLYGKMVDAAEVGTISGKEFARQKAILKENLSWFDRTLTSIVGYTYVRQPKQNRQKWMQKRLESEYYRRRSQATRTYEGEKREKVLKNLRRWNKECRYWIRNKMD